MRVMGGRLYSVMNGTSAETIRLMLAVLFPDAQTILDTTFGNGSFWKPMPAHLSVTGIDLNPERARDVCADFTRLPFADGAFDVAIFDPPYQWDEGKSKRSIMGKRFATYRDEQHAYRTVKLGVMEAWRVGRLGIIVKVQNYMHASLPVRMTRWVENTLPFPPYGEVHLARNVDLKVMDPKWADQLSVYSRSTTFQAYRRGDQRHKRRRPASLFDAEAS